MYHNDNKEVNRHLYEKNMAFLGLDTGICNPSLNKSSSNSGLLTPPASAHFSSSSRRGSDASPWSALRVVRSSPGEVPMHSSPHTPARPNTGTGEFVFVDSIGRTSTASTNPSSPLDASFGHRQYEAISQGQRAHAQSSWKFETSSPVYDRMVFSNEAPRDQVVWHYHPTTPVQLNFGPELCQDPISSFSEPEEWVPLQTSIFGSAFSSPADSYGALPLVGKDDFDSFRMPGAGQSSLVLPYQLPVPTVVPSHTFVEPEMRHPEVFESGSDSLGSSFTSVSTVDESMPPSPAREHVEHSWVMVRQDPGSSTRNPRWSTTRTGAKSVKKDRRPMKATAKRTRTKKDNRKKYYERGIEFSAEQEVIDALRQKEETGTLPCKEDRTKEVCNELLLDGSRCTKAFERKEHLNRHKKTHDKKEWFECPISTCVEAAGARKGQRKRFDRCDNREEHYFTHLIKKKGGRNDGHTIKCLANHIKIASKKGTYGTDEDPEKIIDKIVKALEFRKLKNQMGFSSLAEAKAHEVIWKDCGPKCNKQWP